MIERLGVDDLLEINTDLCAATGENAVCLDSEGLDAAAERPWSGYGDVELFPTLYEKAAALLHAVASRQVFENGNKRTAWAAAVMFLDINGVDVGRVETVQSDMFVRAAALDHSLEVVDLAEWFEVAHRAAMSRDDTLLFQAFTGDRAETPAGILHHGLPTDVRAGNAVIFMTEDDSITSYVVAPDLTPENASLQMDQRAARVVAAFRLSSFEFASLFGPAVDMTRGAASPSPPIRTQARNAPCPCGSGRKYKLCHGGPASAR